jgi:hypothetical protein
MWDSNSFSGKAVTSQISSIDIPFSNSRLAISIFPSIFPFS